MEQLADVVDGLRAVRLSRGLSLEELALLAGVSPAALSRAERGQARLSPARASASWSISLGADVYAVQRMVGHAKPSITLDVYGELWDGSQEQFAERQDEALRKLSPPTEAEVVSLR